MFNSNIFTALADPVRREILNLLKKGKLSAGEISANFNLLGDNIISFKQTKGSRFNSGK